MNENMYCTHKLVPRGEEGGVCVCVSSVYKHQDAELLMLNVYNKSKKVLAGNSFVDKTAHLLSSLLFVEVLLILNNPPGPLPPPPSLYPPGY